jgi:putative nucleotidyltransferase with HDIG domain
MRFATRTFLSSFLPIAILLAVSFWVVRASVISTVRDGLRTSVRDNQVALTREQQRTEAGNQKLLQGIAENSALKAGLQLLITERSARDQARNTVQDQISEIGDTLHADFIMVSDANTLPLAAMVRDAGGFAPVDLSRVHPPHQGFFTADDRLYDIASVPIVEAGAQVASLTVGSRFDITRFGASAVLLHNGSLIAAQTRELAPAQIEKALAVCPAAADCEVNIQDQKYLSLPLGMNPGAGGDGYTLRTLQNVDAASAPLQAVLRKQFLVVGLVALAAMLAISALSTRAIARPLANLAERLRACAAAGEFPEFPERPGDIREIRDLMHGFNQAAKAVRESRGNLTQAYVQFVGSLAQALDARDAYTAGHSQRVSEYSCAIAKAMRLPDAEIENIRVGALLHDIGKIGISDLVLQKPERLTPEEEQLIRRHPVIGKRILANVQGLESYLNIVELHHENWNGTGYPQGLKEADIPLQARIVKVADAYDAMTSDRPYRRGMPHMKALSILRDAAGVEMDATVVQAFATLDDGGKQPAAADATGSLRNLTLVVSSEAVKPKLREAGTPDPARKTQAQTDLLASGRETV